MTFTATSWLILTLTRSGTALGIDAALAFGPVLVLPGPWGGVLADRFDKRADRDVRARARPPSSRSDSSRRCVFTDVVSLWMSVRALARLRDSCISIDNPAGRASTWRWWARRAHADERRRV